MPKRHANRVGSLESLFVRLEELVLASSGEDEFEEIFKLVIAKLYDERAAPRPPHARAARFRRRASDAETEAAISGLLDDASRAWPGVLEDTRPALGRAHLAVCVDALAPHRIADESLEVIDGLFEFLVAKGAKGAKGQYFTPRWVAEFCVRMLDPGATDTVLDPACGSGGFLVHALQHVAREEGLTRAARRRYCETRLFGFDVDVRAARVARVLLRLAGDGDANVARLSSLLRPGSGARRRGAPRAVEGVAGIEGFDLILTNPPFAGEVRERELLDTYELARGAESVERDVLFIERCVELLRPGGRMAIVLPHNKLAAAAHAHVRRWLLDRARVLAVVGLGRHTFLPHTHQKAGVLFLQRNEGGVASPPRDYDVFFAVSQRDGKSSKGQPILRDPAAPDVWSRVDHDLGEIVERFHAFRRTERRAASSRAREEPSAARKREAG